MVLLFAVAFMPMFATLVVATNGPESEPSVCVNDSVSTDVELPKEEEQQAEVDEADIEAANEQAEVAQTTEPAEEQGDLEIETETLQSQDLSVQQNEAETLSDQTEPEEAQTPQSEEAQEQKEEPADTETLPGTEEPVDSLAEELAQQDNCETTSEVEEEATTEEQLTNSETSTEITNTNNADVNNSSETAGNSGENVIVSEEGVKDSAIDTGTVNVFANVLNIVNTTQYNSEIVQITEDFNNLSTDLLMNHPETSPAQLSADIVAGLCSDIVCQSLTTFKLTNKNNADLTNDVNVNANSGNNSIQNAGQNAEIKTGNVNALINILNIVNTNLINSRWTIATFNVFGDWEGDLVLPSELYFSDYRSLGANANLDLTQVQKVVVIINNDNNIEIANNANTTANSGENVVSADETLLSSEIQTGDSVSGTNVKNYLNTTIINSDWFLNIVNTLGQWTGNIYSLPGQVDFEQTNLGMTFFSTTSTDNSLNAHFADSMAQISSDNTVVVEIENSNNAKITNNADNTADSGNNEITGENINGGRIITGYTRALTNIFNFANTNLINSNLSIGLTNIFGNWNGNIVFGYPDLAVEQKLLQENVPLKKNSRVNYELNYANLASSSMIGSKLTWEFDPEAFSFQISDNPLVTEKSDGLLEIDFGRLKPMDSGKLQIQLTTDQTFDEGDEIPSLAKISGSGPEKNLANNISNVVSLASSQFNNVPAINGTNPDPPVPFVPTMPVQMSSTINLIHVEKSNNSEGKELKPGDSVDFTIKITSQNEVPIYDAVLFDTLVSPSGLIVSDNAHVLGDILPREEILYEYTLVITESAEAGEYSNSAYIEGTDSLNKFGRTNVSTSRFKVLNQTAQEVVEEDQSLKQDLGLAVGSVTFTAPKIKKVSAGIVKGETKDSSGGIVENIIPEASANELGGLLKETKNPAKTQMAVTLGTLIFAGLIYAAYNSVSRRKHQT